MNNKNRTESKRGLTDCLKVAEVEMSNNNNNKIL